MAFLTSVGELKSALQRVMPAIEKWSAFPSLTCARLEKGTVTATNRDLRIAADFNGEGALDPVLVPAKALFQTLDNRRPDMPVEIARDGDAVSVKIDGAVSFLMAGDISDWPDFAPAAGPGVPLSKTFHKGLIHCAPFISDEHTRYYLHGVYLDGDTLVATDGHALGHHPAGGDLGIKAILHKDMILAALSLPAARSLVFDGSRKVATLRGPDFEITAKVIDGYFPDWRLVVPDPADARFFAEFDGAELTRALRRIQPFADDPHRYVCLAIGGGGAGLSTIYAGGAFSAHPLSPVAHTPLQSDDDDQQMFYCAVNGVYLARVLGRLRGAERVRLSFFKADGEGPFLASAAPAGDSGLVQMPLRGQSRFRNSAVACLDAVAGTAG
ncbi:MAG: hypothetical protein JJ902_23440 [Roseibium sp.]|nr:hypothetical protein [Roseibium sp.]